MDDESSREHQAGSFELNSPESRVMPVAPDTNAKTARMIEQDEANKKPMEVVNKYTRSSGHPSDRITSSDN